jgi:hypothetical protein
MPLVSPGKTINVFATLITPLLLVKRLAPPSMTQNTFPELKTSPERRDIIYSAVNSSSWQIKDDLELGNVLSSDERQSGNCHEKRSVSGSRLSLSLSWLWT